MSKHIQFVKNRASKVGLPPGTLSPGKSTVDASLYLFQYNSEWLEEGPIPDIGNVNVKDDLVTWINIEGSHDIKTIEKAGKKFSLHPLMLEDISSPDQRPKLDEYDDNLFLTLRALEYDSTKGHLDSDQMSFVLGKNYLLTFQEKVGDSFDPNRERIRHGKGKTRKCGSDYLMYSLLDNVVDHYFVVIEHLGERLENLELDLIKKPKDFHLEKIYQLRNDLLYLKKVVMPVREVIGKLVRDHNLLISKETRMYLKDVLDHAVHVVETVESYRELLSSMMDLYLTSANNRMNEVMKMLTAVATIFIPLTFITGLYGMNFEYMPELRYKYSYPILLAIIVGLIFFQWLYFRRKKWF